MDVTFYLFYEVANYFRPSNYERFAQFFCARHFGKHIPVQQWI
jgi:hypothetical protein